LDQQVLVALLQSREVLVAVVLVQQVLVVQKQVLVAKQLVQQVLVLQRQQVQVLV
jgi:hypothetical protein